MSSKEIIDAERGQYYDPEGVLAAIDAARFTDYRKDGEWPRSAMTYSAIASWNWPLIEAIRTAYLASKQPSDGGEFERKIKNLRYMPESAKQILSDAHNADRAADKQRIADLEASGEHIFCALMDARKRIAEREAQNLNMMALLRDFYDLEFNRDECWEIIKKYGGDA